MRKKSNEIENDHEDEMNMTGEMVVRKMKLEWRRNENKMKMKKIKMMMKKNDEEKGMKLKPMKNGEEWRGGKW